MTLTTPELDKQAALIKSGQPQVVEDFIDWLNANGYCISIKCTVEHDGYYCGVCQDTGISQAAVYDFESLMAEHFGIDRHKVEEERTELLRSIRA